MKKIAKFLSFTFTLAIVLTLTVGILPLETSAAEMPYYDLSSFSNQTFTWVLDPNEDIGQQFYDRVSELHANYAPDEQSKTYITDHPHAYSSNSGWFWSTDGKTHEYSDGDYYVYLFECPNLNTGIWVMREVVIDLRIRHIASVSISGAPAGYGGVKHSGQDVSSVEFKSTDTFSLEVVDVPGHRATVSYAGATCSVSGNVYTFRNVNASFLFSVNYEAVDFATVSFNQPTGATIAVNGKTTSPVQVISGLPYTVTLNASNGYAISNVSVDGAPKGLSGASISFSSTAGAKNATHTIAATTESVVIEVKPSGTMAYDYSWSTQKVVEAIYDAIYLSSNSNYQKSDLHSTVGDGKPLRVQVFGTDLILGTSEFRTLEEYTSGNNKNHLDYVKGQNSIRVRLAAGNNRSAESVIALINPNFTLTPIVKDYTGKRVSISTQNQVDVFFTSSSADAEIWSFTYYDSNKTRLNSAPIEPGSYYVRVTLNEGKFLSSLSTSDYIPLTIRGKSTLRVTGVSSVTGSKTYDGKTGAPSFSVSVKDKTTNTWSFVNGACENFPFDVEYAYSYDGTSFVDGLPQNAGSYTVRVTVEGYSASGTYVIHPKEVTATVALSDKFYDGSTAATVSVSVDTGIEGELVTVTGVTGHFESALASEQPIPVTIDASNAEYLATRTDLSNYRITIPTTASASISPASLSAVSVSQKDTLTYNGKEQTVTLTAVASAQGGQTVTFVYSLSEDGEYGALPPLKNAGSYTVWYRASAEHHQTACGSFTVQIAKQSVTPPTIADKTELCIQQKADVAQSELYSVEKNDGGVAAGSYEVLLKLTDPQNYTWQESEESEYALSFKIVAASNGIHSFGEYHSDNNATTEQDGTKTAQCLRCEETHTVTEVGSKLSALSNDAEESADDKSDAKEDQKGSDEQNGNENSTTTVVLIALGTTLLGGGGAAVSWVVIRKKKR